MARTHGCHNWFCNHWSMSPGPKRPTDRLWMHAKLRVYPPKHRRERGEGNSLNFLVLIILNKQDAEEKTTFRHMNSVQIQYILNTCCQGLYKKI
jgi:hypothetical protein